MKDMNGRDAGGFLLWSYLSLIADGTEWALSSAAVEETCGIKKDAYDRAVAMLIDKGYLVRRSGSNVYDFYQTPQTKRVETTFEKWLETTFENGLSLQE